MNQNFGKYLVSLLLLGSTGTIAAQIHLPSYDVVFWRVFLGGLCLLAFCAVTKRNLAVWRQKRDAVFLVLGGVVLAGNWLFLFESYAEIGVGLSIILDYCAPALVILVAPVLYHERLTVPKILTLVASMVGIICISSQALQSGISMWGIFCGGIAAVFFVGMILCNREIKGTDGLVGSTVQVIVAAVIISLYVALQGGNPFAFASSDAWAILFLGCVNAGLCYALYFPTVRVLPVQTVAICGYLEPLASVLLSVVVLQELLTPIQWLGAVLILGSAVWCEWQSRRHAVRARKWAYHAVSRQ